MSAVSSESPRVSADLTSQPASNAGTQGPGGPHRSNGSAPANGSGGHEGRSAAGTDFGPNQWLVDELYQRYQADPSSVDRAWWNFFADYQPQPPEPSSPAAPGGLTGPAPSVAPPAPAAPAAATPALAPAAPPGEQVRLRGAAARTAANMTASLVVPTATSVRAVPAKLLVDNRIVINNHLARGRGGKVSFTHLIGYAIVRALALVPEMNNAYADVDGKPVIVQPGDVNLGLAIDIRKADGSRQLLVPSIKSAQTMDFRQFWIAYEDVVRKARGGKLTVEDFAGTTISLTNPGTIGTEHSVPRLMQGQGCIVGVGAMEYPAAYQGASAETIARMAISKTVTLTSTYDHRIIQGAQSGDFLRVIHQLLLGEDGFYDEVFQALQIPYEPVRWERDIQAGHEDDITKAARVHELIHAYRVRGHLMADTDPLEYRQRKHPDLDINQHGLTLWDLEREFATGGFGGEPRMELRKILGVLRDSYCRTVGVEYMHIQNPEERAWTQNPPPAPPPGSSGRTGGATRTSSCASCPGSTWPRRSRCSCRRNSSVSADSPWKAPSR
jgi:multifunctional 2-oxoglutarate metabolism enzyme